MLLNIHVGIHVCTYRYIGMLYRYVVAYRYVHAGMYIVVFLWDKKNSLD